MTKNVVELPFGVIQLLKLGDCVEFRVNSDFAHRPDKILSAAGASNFRNEMANNRASNASPISMKVNSRYCSLGTLFLSYFKKKG